MIESAVERLINTNPSMEIWWDSSPLVYAPWVKKILDMAPPAKKEEWREQLGRLYNAENPAQSVVRGCTTNPPLSWTAVQSDPKYWGEWIAKKSQENPALGTTGERGKFGIGIKGKPVQHPLDLLVQLPPVTRFQIVLELGQPCEQLLTSPS